MNHSLYGQVRKRFGVVSAKARGVPVLPQFREGRWHGMERPEGIVAYPVTHRMQSARMAAIREYKRRNRRQDPRRASAPRLQAVRPSRHWHHMARISLTAIIAAIGLINAAFAADALTPLAGRVVAVLDGDTITLLDARMAQHRVRMNGIDAPERGQPGAQRSKESLSALVYEQPIRVEWQARDPYGRVVGKVWVASPDSTCRGRADCPMMLDAGLAQIAMGRAWWFRAHADELSPEDRVRYESAEAEARRKKAGIWRDGTAVPPWQWRAARSR